MVTADSIGWVATALFATSYFCKTSIGMRRLQALAAVLWLGYGVWMNALPIIVANGIVATLAMYTNWKDSRERARDIRKMRSTD